MTLARHGPMFFIRFRYKEVKKMDHTTIKQGMKVVDSAGDFIGIVKELREVDFLVDRPLQQDIDITYSAIASAEGVVTLNIDIPEVLRRRGELPKM